MKTLPVLEQQQQQLLLLLLLTGLVGSSPTHHNVTHRALRSSEASHQDKVDLVWEIAQNRARAAGSQHPSVTGITYRQRHEQTSRPGVVQNANLGQVLDKQFQVVNDNSTACLRESFMCKYSPECLRRKPQCLGRVFITGCSGSGTHTVANTLKAISDKVVSVSHEQPQRRPAVLVSWPTRCAEAAPRSGGSKLQHQRFGFPPGIMKPPMVNWASSHVQSKCFYRTVVHVVRHPLSFLSSNLAFGQCAECWTLVEQHSLPPIHPLTQDVRDVVKRNRVELRSQTGGRTWDARTQDTLLRGYMLYWITWNRAIEGIADLRFRIEHTDLRELCRLLELGSDRSCREGPINLDKNKQGQHGGEKDVITWDQLGRIDADLAQETWALAQAYGYNRSVPVRTH